MKRILKRMFAALCLAALAIALLYGSGWLLSLRLMTEIPAEVTLLLPEQTEVGTPVIAELRFELPLCRSVTQAKVRSGNGAVAGAVQLARGNWRFQRRSWRASFPLYALRAGTVSPGTVTLELGGRDPESVERIVPEFTAILPHTMPAGELELAEAIEIPKPFPWLRIGGIVAALCILIGLSVALLKWLCRPVVPSSRERLEYALRQLRQELASGELNPEQGYIKLTDLVRDYLEERYGIPASTRTTAEFLVLVNGSDSPLPKTEHPFLQEFLAAADKIKFAAFTPDLKQLEQAIQSAERLAEKEVEQ